ncbi:MAG: hypothetical protein GX604_02310 [Actinobacteria bacterium]|nr:hypothetical protein [Actinomycetota bacterium]
MKDAVEIRCEACGRRLKRPLERLRRNPRVQCPNCYRDIIVPLDVLAPEREDWDEEHPNSPLREDGRNT